MTKKISFVCIQIIVFSTPLAFYTGTKDNFLIKETIFYILGLAVALLLILKILVKKQQIKSGWLGFPLILYLAAIASSSVNAVHRQLVFEFLFFWIVITSVYFTAREFSDNDSKKILDIIFVSTFIVTVYGVLQYLGLDPVKWLYDFSGKPFSTFGNPNFFSGYLLLVFPLIFVKMISTRQPSKHIFWMVFCFLVVFNIGIAKTRGAWLAFFLAVVCLTVWQKMYLKVRFITAKRIFRGTFWLFLLFSAVFIISIDRFNMIKSFFGEKNVSVNERIFKWKTGMEMIKEHPFFGVGAGNLKVNFANYQSKIKRSFRLKSTSESNLHNEFLQRFSETGIFGIIAFISVFFVFFFRCAKLLYDKMKSEESEFNLIMGIFTGAFSVFVYGLTNFPFSIVPVASSMFVLFGISESLEEKKYLTKTSQKHPSLLLFLVILTGWIFLICEIVIPRFTSDIARRKGDLYFSVNALQLAASEYEKAIKLDYYHSERTAFDLGEAYRKFDEYDKAIAAYKISVALRNYGEVYNNMGNCYYFKGDFDNALFYWKKATGIGLPDEETQQQVLKSIAVLENKK
ncbi:MAG: O-antigen ligase family protein [Elusimicrobiota bacterium]